MECIGNSDALYHNVEHTMLVTLAGHSILSGRYLPHPPRGRGLRPHPDRVPRPRHRLCPGPFEEDDNDGFVIDAAGTKVSLPRGASDASLMMYHVDRSKLYVMRAACSISRGWTRERIASAIEGTRFPAREGQEYDDEASILRAADFIGQLGDPNYLAQGQRALLRIRRGRHKSRSSATIRRPTS